MSAGSYLYDHGATVGPRFVSIIPSITAGGSGDNTKVIGATLDRFDGGQQHFNSAALSIAYEAALAQGATLSFAVEIQESEDGSTWDTVEEVQASTVAATGPTGGGIVYGCVRLRESYEVRSRYIRYNVTPNLSASGTDTAKVAVIAVMGGANTLPVGE